MKKVGILGGTFDPPHIGHLIIANEVLHAKKLDEIWFMPNQEPPHKMKSGDVTNAHRVDMVQLSIEAHTSFRIQTIEMDREGKSYTFDTMKLLEEAYPDIDFYFIIGADMVEYLPKWYKIQELLKMVQFISVNRPKYELETDYPVQYVKVPDINISSSLIRERVKAGETISFLVRDAVKRYIEENRLYEA
ncbi:MULTISPECIES: nicotinate-nucleotide adenylyltransferase [Bacillaceae]|uniref:Probable nicotinate-nucleotide adenylyltransferase n=1 Tax=Niallia hominis TaxID=3133173 RepID=A0ABV1EUQ4_9BACI|nr:MULTISPECIES: nicotinate-nucleotide adenylyltransferase [Bacillaceae]MCF2646841.1 nicotinate-nucleotide adenylyltransferase [Niallia circulans]